MALSRPSVVCDRVRTQISAGLDDELSQLERAMIASHLERCASCREYEVGVCTVAGVLRSSPLEPMTRVITVGRPPRRRVVRSRIQVAAAAAAVVVVGLFAASEISKPDTLRLEPSYVPEQPVRIQYQTREAFEREQAILERARRGHPVQLQGEVL